MDLNTERKRNRYKRIYNQLEELLQKSNNTIAHMSTIAAILHHKFDHFFWTGFYLITDGELIVGPYQGHVACQVLKKDTGVCWFGINSGESIVVKDVEHFPGHIACSSLSKSEIVIPIKDKKGNTIAVLDIDSKDLSSFDNVDAEELENIISLISVY